MIPKLIYNILNNKPLPIYGKGNNSREWIYVKDHCEALLKVFLKGKIGEFYNIGSNKNLNILQVCSQLLTISKKLVKIGNNVKINFVKDRPGHDIRYALNSHKIITEEENINSLFSGYIFNKFIWKKSDNEGILNPINYVPLNRPRTQDKNPLIVENGAFYVFGKSNFDNTRCRLHGNMQSYLMDEIRSVDIDNEDDLIFAENLSKFI